MRKLFFISLLINLYFVDSGFTKERKDEVVSIIRKSTYLGAHGMGYNTKSLLEMSKKLKPSDTEIIFDLYKNRKNKKLLSNTAVTFALASLCDAGLLASEKKFKEKRIDTLDYNDTLNLISNFEECPQETRDRAKNLLPPK